MITLKDWMELVNYKITGGSSYGWNCYGGNAYAIDSWNGLHAEGGFSSGIIFDTKTQTVYEVSVSDYERNRAYRMINPDYIQAHKLEAKTRAVSDCQAWDNVDYVDLETDADFLTKARAIINGQDYDTRVDITLDFTDEELLKYMKLAHERDITFNQFIELALKRVLEQGDFEKDSSESE